LYFVIATGKELAMATQKVLTYENYINHLFEGDCLDVMAHLPEHSIDMVLCDLPYGTTQNKWDSIIPLDRLWEQYNRVVKPNGAVVLTSQGVLPQSLF